MLYRILKIDIRPLKISLYYSDDEHRLIAQYCQSLNTNCETSQIPLNPAQIIASIDAEQRDELESMIHQLEEENR